MLAQRLRRLAGPAFTAGGLLWITLYVSIVIVGVMTGKLAPTPDAHSPLLVRVGIWFLPISALILGVGLLGMFARLEGRARGLGITGVVFTVSGARAGSERSDCPQWHLWKQCVS